MKLPFTKHMYAEHTGNHFKLYCPLQKEWIFVNVYITAEDDMPIVFKKLFDKYVGMWLGKVEAAEKAKIVLYDFFEACEDTKRPFKIRFTELDKKKFTS